MSERFPFTKNRLEKIACADGQDRLYCYDEGESGLCCLVTDRGAKSFYLLRKIDGRARRIRLGTFPDITVDDARKAARIQKGRIATGIDPTAEKRAARGVMTLGELFGHFLETFAKAHKKRWEDDVKQFNRYFGKPEAEREPDDKPAPFQSWRNRRVNTIDSEAVQALHVKLGENHGRYAANRVLALLSSMFNNARLANPTKGIKKFTEEQRVRFMDVDELARFFTALDAEPDKLSSDYFRLVLFTMQRRSNVASMRWADVSFGKREWSLPGATTKNGDPLTVSLTDEAIAVLKRRWDERQEDDVYVFPSYGKTGHLAEPKSAWARILKRANIQNLRVHDLRHTGASWMAINNFSLPIIAKALGHRSLQSTQRYAHVNQSATAHAVGSITAAMMRATVPAAKPAKKSKSKKSA